VKAERRSERAQLCPQNRIVDSWDYDLGQPTATWLPQTAVLWRVMLRILAGSTGRPAIPLPAAGLTFPGRVPQQSDPACFARRPGVSRFT
jgi:hypothetical protein